MPRLVCYSCGRTIWATVPLDQLFAEERRCPRCGYSLRNERRGERERRMINRRQLQVAWPAGRERRVLADRRGTDRRRAMG